MVETRSAFAASSIRRRSAAWTILLDRKDGVRGSSPFAAPRLCTVLAAKGSTATLFGIYVEDTVSAKPRWTMSGSHRRELDRMEQDRGREAEAPWQLPAPGWT